MKPKTNQEGMLIMEKKTAHFEITIREKMLNSRWTRCAPRASGTQTFLCSLQKMKVPRILRQRSTRKHRKGPQPGQQPAELSEVCWAGLWDLERWRFRVSAR